MGDVEVIVSDTGAGEADAAAAAFADGLVVGVAAATAEDAAEAAASAEVTAEVAVATVAAESDRLDRLEALLVAIHDEMLANDATLAEHLAVLLEAEEATMEEAEEAQVEAATAEAEVTEIVAEHEEERAADAAAESGNGSGDEPQAPPAQSEETGSSGRHERAGNIRFRRGRRR